MGKPSDPQNPRELSPRRREKSRTGRYCRVSLVDTETGEEKVLADGPTMTPGEVIEADLSRSRRESDLGWVFTFILSYDHDGQAILPEGARLVPTADRIEALHTVIRRGAWRRFDRTATLGRYLHKALWLEAGRIWRRRQESERVNARVHWLEREAALASRERSSRGAHPDRVLERVGAERDVARMLACTRLSVRQKALVDLMLAEGLSPADALERLRFPMSVWSSLVQKLRRVA